MATLRQIEANRANAKRSTGPVSESGKQASSQNAIRHGLIAKAVVLKVESMERFQELLASLVEEFQPATATEHALVETMAVARWRLMRNWMLLTALLEDEAGRQDPQAGNEPMLAAMAFRTLADSSRALQLLQRYETSLDRQYSRALNNLLKLRPRSADPKPAQPHQALGAEVPPETAPPPALQKFPNQPNLTTPSPARRGSVPARKQRNALHRRKAFGLFSSISRFELRRTRKTICY
jgi:hypothetical protein